MQAATAAGAPGASSRPGSSAEESEEGDTVAPLLNSRALRLARLHRVRPPPWILRRASPTLTQWRRIDPGVLPPHWPRSCQAFLGTLDNALRDGRAQDSPSANDSFERLGTRSGGGWAPGSRAPPPAPSRAAGEASPAAGGPSLAAGATWSPWSPLRHAPLLQRACNLPVFATSWATASSWAAAS